MTGKLRPAGALLVSPVSTREYCVGYPAITVGSPIGRRIRAGLSSDSHHRSRLFRGMDVSQNMIAIWVRHNTGRMLDVSVYETDLADLRREDFWLHRSRQERRLDRNPGRWSPAEKIVKDICRLRK